MHVAYVIDGIEATGGAEKMTVMLAEMCRADADRRMTVVALEDAEPGGGVTAHLRDIGVAVEHYGAAHLLNPVRLLRLWRYLKRGGFDVVHTNLVYANIVGTVAARMARLPVLAGLRSVYSPQSRRDRIRHWLEAVVLQWLADGAMAVGPRTAAAHQDRLGSLEITPIPNAIGVDPDISDARRLHLRRSFGLDEASVVILAVGSLRPAKGYEDLVEAFAMVVASRPDTRLLIAGEGPLRRQLADAVVAAGLQDVVLLLGLRTDVPELLALSDLFVSSSHFEGLSNAVLEAMAAGRVVVVTDVGDSASVVSSHAGIVVPARRPDLLSEAIGGLIDDKEGRHRMGVEARRLIIEHHDPEQWVGAMFELYERIATNAKAAVGGEDAR